MTDLLKIAFVFSLILLLLRKKINIGYVMLIAASLMFLLYRMSPASIASTVKSAITSGITIKLLLALSFIRIFELILREQDTLSTMMRSVNDLFNHKKTVIVSMPLLIGLLPSVGGAYFSCPMVDEATQGLKMKPEEKSFINYWFRHPWEFILPLYPGLLLAAAITHIKLYNLITANLIYFIMVLATGFIFSMKRIKKDEQQKRIISKEGLWSFLPIVVVLLLVVAFHMELHYALFSVIVFMLVFFRYGIKKIVSATKHGFSLDVIILIIGVMLFKEVMESSGAVNNLSEFFISSKIPAMPILFLLPFITGILTGVTVGFVGSTFPLIISLAGSSSLAAVSFAFASGFLGVLLSPVHVCLILTREYFKADMWGIYKMIIPASAIIFCVAIIKYLIFI